VPAGFAALQLRRSWLPGWSDAPARVAEIVLALALVTLLAQLVGVVGLFRPGYLAAAGIALGAAAWRLRVAATQAGPAQPGAEPVSAAASALAAAAVAGT
jgi:hypothetical protein